MFSLTSSTWAEARILLVDDEPNVLSALTRLLRNETYQVFTATGGNEALALMAEHCMDMVVSDIKMPGMDGAELLALVQHRYPECLRILLTGHHDLGAVMRAVNEGHIYHYIAKPWNDDDLRFTLRQALAYQHSERERKRLEQVTQEQNDALKAFNAELEQRVEARTHELQQVADMLDSANAELKHSYVTATRVFSSLINLRLPQAHQTNTLVTKLIKAFLDIYPLDGSEAQDLFMAASLYNLGKLSWEDRLLKLPSEKMFGEDRAIFLSYPETAGQLLLALEPMQGAARIIRYHQERWNGSGFPSHLKGEDIPWGSRLLRLAVDFIELQRGLMLDRYVGRDSALELLRKLSGRVYDPDLCRDFVKMCIEQAPDLGLPDDAVMALSTDKIEPGMLLVRDLQSHAGHLLLNEGRELTAGLIDKLRRFEATESIRYTVVVRWPENTSPEQAPVREDATAQRDTP